VHARSNANLGHRRWLIARAVNRLLLAPSTQKPQMPADDKSKTLPPTVPSAWPASASDSVSDANLADLLASAAAAVEAEAEAEASASDSVSDANLADLLASAAAAVEAEAEAEAAGATSGTSAAMDSMLKGGSGNVHRFMGSVCALPLGPAELRAYGSVCRCALAETFAGMILPPLENHLRMLLHFFRTFAGNVPGMGIHAHLL
jgi:hypothetical protein